MTEPTDMDVAHPRGRRHQARCRVAADGSLCPVGRLLFSDQLDQRAQSCGNVSAAGIVKAQVAELRRPIGKYSSQRPTLQVGGDIPFRQVCEAQAISRRRQHERGFIQCDNAIHVYPQRFSTA